LAYLIVLAVKPYAPDDTKQAVSSGGISAQSAHIPLHEKRPKAAGRTANFAVNKTIDSAVSGRGDRFVCSKRTFLAAGLQNASETRTGTVGGTHVPGRERHAQNGAVLSIC